MDTMHPYERLSLFTVGLILGCALIAVHVFMLARPQLAQSFLKSFPRNALLGQVLLGLGLAWFWLLVAPASMGSLGALAIDLGEFNNAKPLLRILIPITMVLVVISVRDFLAVRALGVLGLLAAAPLLESAFLKNPATRLLVPIYAYGLLTASLFWVGMPYLFRDAVDWVAAESKRWNALVLGGLAYGVALVICALAFWRGY